MQPLRGTKDIMPEDIIFWQHIYKKILEILSLSNYYEIRTPIIESTSLFKRSIGDETDIVNKEMYTFLDQGKRSITLRPEGTASIARSFISNQLYQSNQIQRLWYLQPMFRYERPQNGRQRQFHQLGIECIGSLEPIADTEVIRLAHKILNELECLDYTMEINSVGNKDERLVYSQVLSEYLFKYQRDLTQESLNRLKINPFRLLDSKDKKIQDILENGPKLKNYLKAKSLNHFEDLCINLNYLNIKYSINENLVRGLDYYNYTAFEIKTKKLGSQDTICGGGRYDSLIQELGGPNTPAVGWAIGIERLILIIKNNINIKRNNTLIYIALQGANSRQKIWDIIQVLEKQKIHFELDVRNTSLQKQIKKAYKSGAKICLILGDEEILKQSVTLKWLNKNLQETILNINLIQKLQYLI